MALKCACHSHLPFPVGALPSAMVVKTGLVWDSSLAGHAQFESLVQKVKLENTWV